MPKDIARDHSGRRGLRWGVAILCLLWMVALTPQPDARLSDTERQQVARGPAQPVTDDPQRQVSVHASDGSASRDSSVNSVVDAPNGRIVSRELVSTTLLSLPALGGSAHRAVTAVAVAANGDVIAFVAKASNRPPATDTGADVSATNQSQPDAELAPSPGSFDLRYDQVYLYDRPQNELVLVSMNAEGTAGNGWSGAPALTPDGRYVAFYSWANNLVAGDTNAVQDLFVYDRATKTIERLSIGYDGKQANGRAGSNRRGARPAISAGGRYVAFSAAATNLVVDDTNGKEDVFVYDRHQQVTERISLTIGGVQANADAGNPSISADGRFIAFESRATNLDQARLNVAGASHIYVHDRVSKQTVLVSRSNSGILANGDSTHPNLSDDGRWVVFQSAATNLVAQDNNRVEDIFVFDRAQGTMAMVSVASSGIQGNQRSLSPVFSSNGRYVAFLSAASNLVSNDGNGAIDVFVHDRQLNHTARASVAVTGQWQGEEANDGSIGTPSITRDGQVVVFVSVATNLVAASTNGQASLYIHRRQDPPAFKVTGVVQDIAARGIDGAVVSAGPHQVRTARSGQFIFDSLVGGTYTFRVAAPDYEFAPRRKTVSILRDQTIEPFVGYSSHNGAISFLDLPFAYDGTVAEFLNILRDTDDGGRVDAWFDHDLPDYSKNGVILLWDGSARSQGAYNSPLGCYARRCYDGHDGIDFPYVDPEPETPEQFEPIVVRAAAPGRVVATYSACTEHVPSCNGGYGNEVILAHDNGYLTRYAHLASLAAEMNGGLARGDAVGVMGNSGNSNGVHLHFAVHWDNGNGRWDGESVDRPVDPFGWAGPGYDPWSPKSLPTLSPRLWHVGTATEATLVGGAATTLQDVTGHIVVHVPAHALGGQAKIELVTGSTVIAPAPEDNTVRSVGYTFRLNLLEWLPAVQPATARSDMRLAQPLELNLALDGIGLHHVKLEEAQLYWWSTAVGQWQSVPTFYEERAGGDGGWLYAATDRLGAFDLQAPLRCRGDTNEPDDAFFSAKLLTPDTGPRTGQFDTVLDEDWLQIPFKAGQHNTLTTDPSSAASAVRVQLYAADGLTPLPGYETIVWPGGDGESNSLSWTSAEPGYYFVRMSPAHDGVVACETGYSVRLSID